MDHLGPFVQRARQKSEEEEEEEEMFHGDRPMLTLEAANKDSFRVDCIDGELPPAKRHRKRRTTTRWNKQSTYPEHRQLTSVAAHFPPYFTGFLPSDAVNALQTRLRLEELNAILTGQESLRCEEGDPLRSPSPIQTYDMHGKRDNTREVRKRTFLTRERQYIVDFATKLNPTFKPPH